MKNKSEFFIKHLNYSINYSDFPHTCQDLVPVYFIKFFITLIDFACSMISNLCSSM